MKPRARVQTIVKQNRTPEILAALKKAKGSYVTVGVHPGAGVYEDGTPVEKVALWQEWGTENMPARPFMAPAMTRNKGKIAKVAARSLADIAYLHDTVAHGLSRIGFLAQTCIQNVIKSNVGPALSGEWDPPSGYLGWRRRHFAEAGQRTLVRSGLLLRSVRYLLHLTGHAQQEQQQAQAMRQEAHPAPSKKQAAENRAAARKLGEAQKERQRRQRQHAAAKPTEAAAAFQAQHWAYKRNLRKGE